MNSCVYNLVAPHHLIVQFSVTYSCAILCVIVVRGDNFSAGLEPVWPGNDERYQYELTQCNRMHGPSSVRYYISLGSNKYTILAFAVTIHLE